MARQAGITGQYVDQTRTGSGGLESGFINETAGSTVVTGTLAATSPADTAAFAGAVHVKGALSASSPADTAAFIGRAGVHGTLAAISPADIAAFAGAVHVKGTLAATSPADIAAFRGTAGVVTGSFAVASPSSTALFHGTILTPGVFVAVQLCGIADYPLVCLAISDEVVWSAGGFDYPAIETEIGDE
jgi:hypothetical protein